MEGNSILCDSEAIAAPEAITVSESVSEEHDVRQGGGQSMFRASGRSRKLKDIIKLCLGEQSSSLGFAAGNIALTKGQDGDCVYLILFTQWIGWLKWSLRKLLWLRQECSRKFFRECR